MKLYVRMWGTNQLHNDTWNFVFKFYVFFVSNEISNNSGGGGGEEKNRMSISFTLIYNVRVPSPTLARMGRRGVGIALSMLSIGRPWVRIESMEA